MNRLCALLLLSSGRNLQQEVNLSSALLFTLRPDIVLHKWCARDEGGVDL